MPSLLSRPAIVSFKLRDRSRDSSRAPEGASAHGGAVFVFKSVALPRVEERVPSASGPPCHKRRRAQCVQKADPQPGVVRDLKSKDRNVRSKRRCSCVLQFTCRRAICCVLHRPTSRVIHRSGL